MSTTGLLEIRWKQFTGVATAAEVTRNTSPGTPAAYGCGAGSNITSSA
jgi:hypothetical protein